MQEFWVLSFICLKFFLQWLKKKPEIISSRDCRLIEWQKIAVQAKTRRKIVEKNTFYDLTSLARSHKHKNGKLNISLVSGKAWSHLSKDPSDLTQKSTQLPIPILGTVFNPLSLGVIHFVRSVSLRNRYLIGWWANQKLSFQGF